MATRKKFTSKFKTAVVLEALKERMTVAELAQKHDIHPTQINTWKREFLNKAEDVFEGPSSGKSNEETEKDKLLKAIGKLKVENDFLKDALR